MQSPITLLRGDITRATADAIVNAANAQMLGGGGVDGAIHAAAGPALLEACREVPANENGERCPAGEARITGAGELNAQFVIHTVGPRYTIDPQPERLLARAYQRSLQLAIAHNCRSIGFPAISCGVYGYPYDEAARIALNQCALPEYAHMDIRFYLFGEEIFSAWEAALAQLHL